MALPRTASPAVAGTMILLSVTLAVTVSPWFLLLGVGAALMLVGQLATPAGWLSALLVSVGAALGGLPLLWTLILLHPAWAASSGVATGICS